MATASLLPQGGGLSNPTPTLYSPSHKPSDPQQDPAVAEIFGRPFQDRYVLLAGFPSSLVDLIRDIRDPEHPHTLEELHVVSEDCITVRHHLCSPHNHRVDSSSHPLHSSGPSQSTSSNAPEPTSTETNSTHHQKEEEEEEEEELWIKIVFTPTVPHCSLATLIGLCLRIKLERSLETRFKLDIVVSEGAHAIEGDVNKQINDKERVAAAMENPGLREMVEECIKEAEY